MYIKIFIYGIFAACFALILELILFGLLPTNFFGFLETQAPATLSLAPLLGLFFFSLIEEGSRFLFLLRFKKNISELSASFLEKGWLLAGATFGLGFGGLEIGAAFLFDNLSQVIFLPGTVILHVLLSVGIAFLVFRLEEKKRLASFLFLLAVVIHLLYNVFLLLF